MSVFFTNPNQILASFMAREYFNTSITMERRHLEDAEFKCEEMHEIQSKVTLQQRVKYVTKLPREGSVLHNNVTFRTNYSEAQTPTRLFMVDDIIVVFLDQDNPSRKRPMGTIDTPVAESKNSQLESIKKNFYASTAVPVCKLGIMASAFTAGRFLVGLLARDGSSNKIQAVAQVALLSIAILGWWRVIQWILCISKVVMMRHTGDWVAQLRGYAYIYPSVVREGAIQRFLMPNEIKYLQARIPTIFQRLKNNLSL